MSPPGDFVDRDAVGAVQQIQDPQVGIAQADLGLNAAGGEPGHDLGNPDNAHRDQILQGWHARRGAGDKPGTGRSAGRWVFPHGLDDIVAITTLS